MFTGSTKSPRPKYALHCLKVASTDQTKSLKSIHLAAYFGLANATQALSCQVDSSHVDSEDETDQTALLSQQGMDLGL